MNSRNIPYKVARFVLICYILVGIFAPFIAGDVPILSHKDGKWSMPILAHYNPWHDTDYRLTEPYDVSQCMMPLISHSPQGLDLSVSSSMAPLSLAEGKPWRYRHYLGTDRLGRDVAAGMIHGTSTALVIVGISVFLSFLIGVSLGMVSAFYGGQRLRLSVVQILFTIMSFVFTWYYLWYEWIVFAYLPMMFCLFFISACFIVWMVNHYLLSSISTKKYTINTDLFVMKAIEVRKSIPGLFLILALVTIFDKPSLWNIVGILTLLGWADFARYARAETLVIKEENYILSTQVLGFSDGAILYKQILPNIMPTLIVVICFAASSAILMESSLSFLGIGLPVGDVTWGKILAEGRKNMDAWWLVVFPGLAIFIFILCINTLVTHLQMRINK